MELTVKLMGWKCYALDPVMVSTKRSCHSLPRQFGLTVKLAGALKKPMLKPR